MQHMLTGLLLSQLGAVGSAVFSSAEDAIAVIEGRIHEPTFRPVSYSVSDYGAVGDGASDDLHAFRAAINAANLAGGGTVETTDSTTYYLEGSLELLSNVRLRLGSETTLKWSSNPRDYTTVLTKFEGTEVFNYSPLLRAYVASNVSVVGAGPSSCLDGGGEGWFEKNSEDADRLREMGNDSVPVYSRVFGSIAELPPNFIEPFGAQAFHIENLTIRNSPFWTVHPVASQNIICRGLKIQTTSTKNSDGIDPEGSVDVLIEAVDFDTGDDAVAVKAGRDADGWRIGRPSRNIIVRRCTLSSLCNALNIGSEVSGGVQSVYFYDNTITNAEVGLYVSLLPKYSQNFRFHRRYFKSNLDRGSFVRDVHVWDIRAFNVEKCIGFTNDYHGSRGGHFPTEFDAFDIRDFVCSLSPDDDNKPVAIAANGVDYDHPIVNVTLFNITINSKGSGATVNIHNVSHFDLVDVFIDGARIDKNYTTTDRAPAKFDELQAKLLYLVMRDDDDFDDEKSHAW